jgi:hypothetical protein
MIFALFLCGIADAAVLQNAATRADVQTYLQSVYPLSNFTAMSDAGTF